MEPRDAKDHFRDADDLFRGGKYEYALQLLDELNREFPGDRRVMYPLARCLAELGRTDEAVRVCDVLINQFAYEKAARLRAKIIEKGPLDDDDLEISNLDVVDIFGDGVDRTTGGTARGPHRRLWLALVITLVLVALLMGLAIGL